MEQNEQSNIWNELLTFSNVDYYEIIISINSLLSFHSSMDFVSVNNLKIEVLFKSSMPGQENDIRSILLK